MNKQECDICGKKTNHLVDYFAMLCQECKEKHTDMILIKRIGSLMNKIEDLEKPKQNKPDWLILIISRDEEEAVLRYIIQNKHLPKSKAWIGESLGEYSLLKFKHTKEIIDKLLLGLYSYRNDNREIRAGYKEFIIIGNRGRLD